MNAFAKLQSLEASAGPEIKIVEITIGDQTEQFRIKRLSFADTQAVGTGSLVENDDGGLKIDRDKMNDRNAHLISLSVVEDDGTRALTIDQIKQLSSKIALQLLKAVNEFNGLVKSPVEAAAKNSSPTQPTATS